MLFTRIAQRLTMLTAAGLFTLVGVGCTQASGGNTVAMNPQGRALVPQDFTNQKGHLLLNEYWAAVRATQASHSYAPYALTGTVARRAVRPPFNAQNYTDSKGHVHLNWYWSNTVHGH